MSFEQSLQFFKEHQNEFIVDNYGKFVVIIDGEVMDFYDDMQTAYLTTKNQHPDKQFLLRKCIKLEEEEMPFFHSRVY